MKRLFHFFIYSLLLISCSKSSNEKDQETPVISISSPTTNQVFTAGETIHIRGTISDNQFISQVHIEVNDINTGHEYLLVHIHPNSTVYALDQAFTAGAGIRYKIKITADD